MSETTANELEKLRTRLDKFDSSIKYFATNLIKLRNLPNDLKTLEARLAEMQRSVVTETVAAFDEAGNGP